MLNKRVVVFSTIRTNRAIVVISFSWIYLVKVKRVTIILIQSSAVLDRFGFGEIQLDWVKDMWTLWRSFTLMNILQSVSNHLEGSMCNHLEWSSLSAFLKAIVEFVLISLHCVLTRRDATWCLNLMLFLLLTSYDKQRDSLFYFVAWNSESRKYYKLCIDRC